MPGILISVLKSLKNRALMLFVSFLMFCCVATAGGTEQLGRCLLYTSDAADE